MRGLHLSSTVKHFQMLCESRFLTSVKTCFSSQQRGIIVTSQRNCSISSFVGSPVGFRNCCIYQFVNQGCHHYSTSSEKTIISKNISLQTKRVPRKKLVASADDVNKEKFEVVACSSAKAYNMPLLSEALKKQGLYKQLPLPEKLEDVLYTTAVYQIEKEPRHVFFFGTEGCVVFWNIPQHEQKTILQFLKDFEINSYDENLVSEEKEDMEYLYTDGETKLLKGRFMLNANENVDLAIYAFSNALTHSVKLALWEASLETYIESMYHLEQAMCDGKKVRLSRAQLFRKHGELFILKHSINLRSEMLDTPDFYWDREDLETLYRQTYNYLNMPKRIRVMNERLSNCADLIDMLSNHFTDKHHINLELMIIALILVEVILGCATLAKETVGNVI